MHGHCGSCRHFVDDAATLERELTGLTILSSAYGDTRGDQGICRLHEQMLLPRMTCGSYQSEADDSGLILE